MGPATASDTQTALLCPSSQPDVPGSALFAVVSEKPGEPRVSYVQRAVPLNAELLALAGPLDPTRVMRVAAPCQTDGCPHFSEQSCTLATKIVQALPEAVDTLAPCPIRKTCRWFVQEGTKACMRCPDIATHVDNPSELQRALVDPKKRALRHLPVLP